MRDFNFNDMSDEEFREEFLRILSMYQNGMGGFMKQMYGNEPTDRGVGDDEILKRLFGRLPGGVNDSPNWESKSWLSPDGNSNFRSYKRTFLNGKTSTPLEPKVDRLELLDIKLNEAIEDERYIDARDIHNLIKDLQEVKKDIKDTKE